MHPPVASVIDTVVNLAKRRGFVFPSGEIYGGTRSAWDYGPLGVELKENIKRQWWRSVVTGRDDVVGLDSSIILPRQVWVASGHVEVFHDPLVESLITHKRYRADHLIEAYEAKHGHPPPNGLADIRDPETGEPGQWTEPREFNMMLKTYLGPIETEEGLHYLRPETAQGIFVNFANVMTTARRKPPFGIGQIGKSFRTKSRPATSFSGRENSSKWKWSSSSSRRQRRNGTSTGSTRGCSGTSSWGSTRRICASTNTRRQAVALLRPHRRHRVQVRLRREPLGRAGGRGQPHRLRLVHARQAFRGRPVVLRPGHRHAVHAIRHRTGRRPDAVVHGVLIDAYTEDEAPNAKGGMDKRTVLRLDPRLAPVKAAVLPLSRHADLSPKARDLAAELRRCWNIDFDDAGAIGRRYRRQDEVGTPFCVTVDFDSLEDGSVTVRERDKMTQERIAMDAVCDYLATRLKGC